MFADRADAAAQLVARLAHLSDQASVVFGLPRGGVPVARVVADALGAPLDVLVVRKLGVPIQPELAMGAIGENGVRVLDERVIGQCRLSPADIDRVEGAERQRLEERTRRLRAERPPVAVDGLTAIVVDDGLATGSSARAACEVIRAAGAGRVVLAVPVAPSDWTARMGNAADEYIAVHTPQNFAAVGQFYRDFRSVSDEEVTACLDSK